MGLELQNITGEDLALSFLYMTRGSKLGVKTCFRVLTVDEYGRVLLTIVQYGTDSNQIWHVASDVLTDWIRFENTSEVLIDWFIFGIS
jgi:hypothetical protein